MRYRIPILTALIALAVLLGLDSLAWWRVQTRLTVSCSTALDHARQQGWAIHYDRITHSGWPLGATLTLSEPRATQTSSATDAPKIGWAAHGLTLGGYWPDWLSGGLPLTLTGKQALRIVDGTTITTLTASTLSGHLLLGHARTRLVHMAGTSLHLDVSDGVTSRGAADFEAPALHLLINKTAGAEATRLGLRLSADHVSLSLTSPSFAIMLANPDLALALTGSPANTSETLWSRSAYSKLLIQYAAAAYEYEGQKIDFDVTAALSMPDLSGDATLRLPHWRRAATTLLALPQIRRNLPLQIINELSHYVSDRKSSVLPETLTLSTMLHGGRPPLLHTKFSSPLTRMFDALPERE